MALDGIAIAGIIHELKQSLLGGRIDKIYQPESDEIVLMVRSLGHNLRLLLTSNPSHPRLHLTGQSKQNPMTAPLFCMVLRKHLQNGKIIDITQPNFERIVFIHIEAINELGDLSVKKLIIEIMGKHSNIMLIDENGIVLDSIKRVSHDTSSVREVLPGKEYVFPPSQGKLDPLLYDKSDFMRLLGDNTGKAHQAIYKTYSGISPVMACEICRRAGVDQDAPCSGLDDFERERIADEFGAVIDMVRANNFGFEAYYNDDGKIFEFAALPLTQFGNCKKDIYNNTSEMLEAFYAAKDGLYRASQKTQDLRKIVTQNIERCVKKKDLQANMLGEIENRDGLKIYGELITANIYQVRSGDAEVTLYNYYDGSEITIPLEQDLSPAENAQAYFKKYNKQKRTFQALQEQAAQNDAELEYLETVLSSLQTLAASDEADIDEIRDELAESGYVKKRKNAKQKQKKSKPLQFKSADGFDIYVGKNNKQNDELTLKFAKNEDIWLHTKEIPGSHVIIKTNGRSVPDSTLTEAVNLAAYYSKARNSSLVPVDYTFVKNVKKPSGAKPGMVIYDVYKTAYITPVEVGITS